VQQIGEMVGARLLNANRHYYYAVLARDRNARFIYKDDFTQPSVNRP
jgi:hypothetical protein